jgi:ferredoxin, 2Fe-2S
VSRNHWRRCRRASPVRTAADGSDAGNLSTWVRRTSDGKNPSSVHFSFLREHGFNRLGFTWPSVCGGEASCRTCFVIITDGHRGFPPPDAVEQRALDELRLTARRYEGPLRLACQAAPTADAVVIRRGMRRRIVATIKESP